MAFLPFHGAAAAAPFDFRELEEEARIQQREAVQASIDLEKRRQARHRQRLEARVDAEIEAEKRAIVQQQQQYFQSLNPIFEQERRFRKSAIQDSFQHQFF